MVAYVALSVSLISCLGMSLSLWLSNRNQNQFITLLQNQSQLVTSQLLEMVMDQRKVNQDLLNRMMAADLPSYQAMTFANSAAQSASVSDPYISHSDEAEVQRLADAQGYGLPIFDEDTELYQVINEMSGGALPGED